jgi:hypothetical protein
MNAGFLLMTNTMKTEVRIIKRGNYTQPVDGRDKPGQSTREVVDVVKGWIREFEKRKLAESRQIVRMMFHEYTG